MGKTARLNQQEGKDKLYTLYLVITLGLIAMPAYFRGLYFEYEQFIVYLISFTTLIVYTVRKFRRKDSIKLYTYLDYSLIALIGAYTVSIPFATNYRLAISELLKYMNYFVIYLLIKELIVSQKYIKLTANTILIGITGVAFIGIGAAAATFKYHGAYSEAANERWINSTLQYHNAFGAFTMCGILLCYALYSITNKLWAKVLYSIAAYTMFLGFIFSYSRGSWVVFPIAFIVLVIILWKKSLPGIIIMSLSMVASVSLIAGGFRGATLERLALPAWKWFFIGVIICAAVTVLLEVIRMYIEKLNISKKVLVFALAAIVIIAVIAVFVFAPGIVARLIPEDLLARFKDINFESETVKERFVFYLDALKIIRDYPIFGAGGGGWQSIYFMYQSYLYWSTQAHSYIMQVWIETGTVGFLIILSSLILFAVYAIKNLRFYSEQKEEFILQAGIFTAAGSLILHSFIDFDLSLSGISIVLWAFFALTSVYSRLTGKHKTELYKFSPAFVFVPLVIMGLVTISFASAAYCTRKVAQYSKIIKSNEVGEAEAAKINEKIKEMLSLAVSFDPLTASYRIDYGNALEESVDDLDKNRADIIKAEKHMAAALSLDRFNPQIHAYAGAFYLKTGDIDKGLELFDRAVELQPLRPENYNQVADAYIKVVQAYLKANRKEKIKDLLNRVIRIEEEVQSINAVKMKPVELDEETLKIIDGAKKLLTSLGA